MRLKVILMVAYTAYLVQSAEYMNNIQFLASGYDIFKGNPQATYGGLDPGFAGTIFKFDYSSNLKTADQRFFIPDCMDFRPDFGCALSFSSKSISNMTEYQNSLEVDVEVDFTGFGQKFSASADYQRTNNLTKTQKMMITNTRAQCFQYDGRMNTLVLPEPNNVFLRSIKALPTTYNEAKYSAFILYYGTHFIDQVKMGSKYGLYTTFTQEGYKAVKDTGVDIELAASLAAFGISGTPKVLTDFEKKSVDTFNKNKKKTYVYSLGSKPPADGKASTWAQASIEEPMPVWYHLQPLTELFSPINMPGIANLATLKSNLHNAIASYCLQLKKQGKKVECEDPKPVPPPPPPPPPPPVPHEEASQCRLCSNYCGNGYTAHGGTIALTNDPSVKIEGYGTGCSGRLGKWSQNHQVLCCKQHSTPLVPRTKTCRICTSCGHSFPQKTGAVLTSYPKYNWGKVYGESCAGSSPATYGQPHHAWFLCCQNPAPCSLCTSCGGKWPQKTGHIGFQHPDLVHQFGTQCQGSQITRPTWTVFSTGATQLCCQSNVIQEDVEFYAGLSSSNITGFLN